MISCFNLFLSSVAVLGGVGVYFGMQQVRHRKPKYRASYTHYWRSRYYTPEGRRWLNRSRALALAFPFVSFALMLGINAICPFAIASSEGQNSSGVSLSAPPPLLAAAFVLGVFTTGVLMLMLRYWTREARPTLMTIVSSDSYSEIGQRWLRLFRVLIIVGPIVWWAMMLTIT